MRTISNWAILLCVALLGSACVEVTIEGDEPQDVNKLPPEEAIADAKPIFNSFAYVRTCEAGIPVVELTATRRQDVVSAALDCGDYLVPASDATQLTMLLNPFPKQIGEAELPEGTIRDAEFCTSQGCITADDITIVMGQDLGQMTGEIRRLSIEADFDGERLQIESDWFQVCGSDYVPDCWLQGS